MKRCLRQSGAPETRFEWPLCIGVFCRPKVRLLDARVSSAAQREARKAQRAKEVAAAEEAEEQAEREREREREKRRRHEMEREAQDSLGIEEVVDLEESAEDKDGSKQGEDGDDDAEEVVLNDDWDDEDL